MSTLNDSRCSQCDGFVCGWCLLVLALWVVVYRFLVGFNGGLGWCVCCGDLALQVRCSLHCGMGCLLGWSWAGTVVSF